MNEQMRQLLRRPKRFLLTVKPLQPLWRSMGYKIPVARKGKQPLKKAAPPPVAITRPGFELFELVGTNWTDGTERPVAVLWGFHPWKREFVSRYLPEYRLAFARGNTPWPRLRESLDQKQDLTFIAWGMSERPEVPAYAEERNFPLYRMEDGFVRSADLGSRHTTPLSLVLDKQGIYFDASKPSDLEQLLNEHDFSSTPDLLRASRELLVLMRNLKISKYNLGSLQAANQILGPKIRRRVLVIGQVEADASIRHGLGEGWTNHRLIEMAKAENPDAEVIYRPHPDVAQGFRESAHSAEALALSCRVMTEDVMLGDLFQAVDHVYTLTSLSGFEALVHGLPVTVVGAPFYAGWGLTDDRMPVPRRQRSLSLDELFCAAYLLYPRYLGSFSDAVCGCLSAMLQVTAQRREGLATLITLDVATHSPERILHSAQWPAAFRADVFPAVKTKLGKRLAAALPLQRIFASCRGDHFQRSLGYFFAGQLRDTPALMPLMGTLRTCMKLAHYSELVHDLLTVYPSTVLLEHWAWACEESGRTEEARQALEHLAYNTEYAVPHSSTGLISNENQKQVLRLAEFELRRRDLAAAGRKLNALLLSGFVTGEVIAGIVEIARLEFDFTSAAAILDFYNRLNPAWKQGRNYGLQAQCAALAGEADAAIEAMAIASMVNPQWLGSFENFTRVFRERYGDLPFIRALQEGIESHEAGPAISRAVRLVASSRPADAERLLLSYQPKKAEELHYWTTLTLAYSFQRKLDQAKALLVEALRLHPVNLLYREALRLAVIRNDYAWGGQILEQAAARDIDIGDMHRRKVYLGMGDIGASYRTFREMKKARKVLRAYLGNRYVQSVDHFEPQDHAVVAGFFGPGDEIRFASFYGLLKERLATRDITVTCDPRLENLFARSFPDLRFVGSKRARNLASIADYTPFRELPGSDLIDVVDNNGWKAINGADRAMLATDFLGDFVHGYESFAGKPYLLADPVQVSQWKVRLSPWRDKPLIGLTWRSSLTTYSRNEHYLDVKELAPLLEIPGIQFVNLQYDECSKELAYIEAHYPGKMVNFADLDQFNDLEGVAALMRCLDLVIAPATTVAELAGALGCPTLLLSNSSELHWRKRPQTQLDVWHRSMTHVEGERLGDKASLIDATVRALQQRLTLPTALPRRSGDPGVDSREDMADALP